MSANHIQLGRLGERSPLAKIGPDGQLATGGI
jgi:hypothetical protein